MDQQPAEHDAAPGELLQTSVRRHAEQLSAVLMRTALALEWSAELAEDHARREERYGHVDAAAYERRAASRARQAAERARSRAEEWLARSSPGNFELEVGSEPER